MPFFLLFGMVVLAGLPAWAQLIENPPQGSSAVAVEEAQAVEEDLLQDPQEEADAPSLATQPFDTPKENQDRAKPSLSEETLPKKEEAKPEEPAPAIAQDETPATESDAPIDTSSEGGAPETEAPLAEEEEPEKPKTYTAVKLRGLNKTTTRSEEILTAIGTPSRFGNLEIIARGCWVAPPDKRPEQAGLVEVWYQKQGEKPELLFYGWLFASSPSLASLEHPVYDVTMLQCLEELPKITAPQKAKTPETLSRKTD